MTQQDAYTQNLIAMGVDYSAAQDKALMRGDYDARAEAKGGLIATERALAMYLETDEPTALEMILTAATTGREA